ncbi:MAG TPA: DUF523 and DUF1722 domain-containing protein, partial [Vicinamibacterales bacterium]|nr:DUF523 and DUF1722 domain-containing protein [Vicinamibacterales bacterium]
MLRVGVSSCLLGRPVRYDGDHKYNDVVAEGLGADVEFVAVCPEVELGLGTPRETLHLVRHGRDLRTIMAHGEDHTEGMRAYAHARVEQLASVNLAGYVLKAKSPSCGIDDVEVHAPGTLPRQGSGVRRNGQGLFTTALIARFPLLPVEDEVRLADPTMRNHFVERIHAFDRLRALFAPRWTMSAVVRFHTAHKIQLMAHSPEAYRALGRLVARGAQMPRADFRATYESAFMKAIAVRATNRTHANALMHLIGHFRGKLDRATRATIAESIADYRRGL